MSQYQPMSAAQIAQLATSVIELPPFEEGGEPVFVRVKRPNMMNLIKSGKIPNELLSGVIQAGNPAEAAAALMESGSKDAAQDALKIIAVMLEATLVEPKYEEIKDILTDEQQGELLAYAGGGVKALSTFREGPGEPAETSGNGQSVEQAAE